NPGEGVARHRKARERRLSAESAARAALSSRPRMVRRFDKLLAVAQRASVVREDQVAEFTLPWPLLRRAVSRLGQALADGGVLERPEDVYFLTRAELEAALSGKRTERSTLVNERRRTRNHQARLAPPLHIGEVPPMFERIVRSAVEAIRGPTAAGDAGELVGIPA